MKKKSVASIIAGVLFSLIALFELSSVLVFFFTNRKRLSVDLYRNVFILHIILVIVFLLMAVSSFVAQSRSLPVVGFGVGSICAVLLLMNNLKYVTDIYSYMGNYPFRFSFVYLKTFFRFLGGVIDSVAVLALPMLLTLLFVIIALAQKGKKTLKAWFVPGIVAAVCALFVIIISIGCIVQSFSVLGSQEGARLYFNWKGLFILGLEPLFALAVQPLFVVGVFCLMHNYAGSAAAPAGDPTQDDQADSMQYDYAPMRDSQQYQAGYLQNDSPTAQNAAQGNPADYAQASPAVQADAPGYGGFDPNAVYGAQMDDAGKR